MPVKVGATQEYMLGRLGMTIASPHFRESVLKKHQLLDAIHAGSYRVRKRRFALPSKSVVNGVDARFLIDEIDDEDEEDSSSSLYKARPAERNISFSYQTPSVASSFEGQAAPSPAKNGGPAAYNAKEAMNTLKLLRRTNQVDFSKFWGWERKQREIMAASAAAAAAAGGGSGAGASGAAAAHNDRGHHHHLRIPTSPVAEAARRPKPDATSRKVEAVRAMRAVYGQGMELQAGMADSISSVGSPGRALQLAEDDEGDDFSIASVQLSAPLPRPAAQSSTGAASSSFRAGIKGSPAPPDTDPAAASASAPQSQAQPQPRYKANKPLIADLVLTDEHFDAVSKYFAAPLESGTAGAPAGSAMPISSSSAVPPASSVVSYRAPSPSYAQPQGKFGSVVRVSPQSGRGAGSAGPMYVYSPLSSGKRPDSSNNVFSPTHAAGDDSLDELLQFMDAVEGSL